MRARAIASVAVLLCAAARADQAPSEVIYPAQRIPLRFSHQKHLGLKLACDFCHESAEGSTTAKDDLIPSEEACATCHKIDRKDPTKEAKPAARCDACHVGGAAGEMRASVPPPNLKFNHKVHVDRKIECTRCHVGMEKLDLATREQLPRMPLCLSCHNTTARGLPTDAKNPRGPAKCVTCHIARADGTLENDFPSGRLVPSGNWKGDAHGPQFAVEHAKVAAPDEGYCLSCHRRSECLTCHNGVIKPMSFHGNDYVSIHAVDARKNALDCSGCHRRQSFCLGCHERSGVVDDLTTPGGKTITQSGGRFHPPYEEWVQAPRKPGHHSWQAVRNVRTCMSCHREDTCLQCHTSAMKAGSAPYNTSPHPAAFAGSRACEALASRNARVCIKCHTTTDPHVTCR